MKYLDHMPWVPIGETPVRQTDRCWTNGHMAADGTPGEGVEALEPGDALARPQASTIHQIYAWAALAKEDGREAKFLLYYPKSTDKIPVAVLVNSRLEPFPVDGTFVAYFMRKYPGCVFYCPSHRLITCGPRAVGVFHEGGVVGTIMPLYASRGTGQAYLIMADAVVGPPLGPEAGGQHD